MSFNGRFAVPFHVRDGVIYDANGTKVKLWGVNYYTPFNHNFYNIEELGRNHFDAIDEDIKHFRKLGIEFIRMHLYDREITDREGNIVENKNMRVFDYLVEQCEQNGIYLMITPIVWWNTVKNQILQDELYAFWCLDAQDAFGFSNYYSSDAMLWEPEAIQCQATYLEALFSRRSTISGKRMPEYENVIVIEPINESHYPSKSLLKGDPDISANAFNATFSRGRRRLKFVKMWEEFSAAHPEEPDEDKRFSLFVADIMKTYFATLLPVVKKHFGEKVLTSQYVSNGRYLYDENLKECIGAAGFDAYSTGTYLNANKLGFDAENTDSANHLELARKWFDDFDKVPFGNLAKIVYEFDATGTQNGYPLAAIAAMYAKYGIQLAAFFTYTPSAVAAWNPGWLVHYLNIAHTPSRAAGFAAAGEIFRNHGPEDEIQREDEVWKGKDYSIERKNDLVLAKGKGVFRHSNSTDIDLGDMATLSLVSGRGTSRFASCSGNGFYLLEKQNDESWLLTLFPKQRYLTSPERGRQYRFMANRYVNCQKELPVSQLIEDSVNFELKAFKATSVVGKESGERLTPDDQGVFCLKPGEYILETAASGETPSACRG